MIKTALCCDGCGVELEPTIKTLLESQTIVWPMRQFVFCEECALSIDNALLNLKSELVAINAT